MEFEQAITLISLLAVIIISYLSHRSFPPKQTAELIDRLATHAEKTQTKMDDLLLDVARVLNDIREQNRTNG